LPAAAVAAALCMPATAQSQSPQATNSGSKAAAQSGNMNNNGGAVTTAEQQFVAKAAQADRAEVDLANLALQKSNNPDIKQFAQRMVDDHTKNQQQVDSLASKLSITSPSSASSEETQAKDRLQNLSGEQFDRAYARMMVQDHRKDVNEFKREKQTAQNSELKQYVDQTLPVLEQHLQLAEQLNSKVGSRSSSSTR
jgi:putative membrane protein